MQQNFESKVRVNKWSLSVFMKGKIKKGGERVFIFWGMSWCTGTIVLLSLRTFVSLLNIVGSFVSVLVNRYTRTEPYFVCVSCCRIEF